MNERHIYLIERYFSLELTAEEELEFKGLLVSDKDFKNEFDEQKHIQEALTNMKIKEPLPEIWDKYWYGVYNRLERGIGWILFSIGILILAGYGTYSFVDEFLLKNTETPFFLKFGVTSLLFGIIVLIFSVIREKYFVGKSDKYKEIER